MYEKQVKMLVIGANGLAKQLLDVFDQLGKTENLFFFEDCSGKSRKYLYNKYPILGSDREVMHYFRDVSAEFTLGIGNPQLRCQMCLRFEKLGGNPTSLVSPFARVGKYSCVMENGVLVMTNCLVENGAFLGKGTLVNYNASVSHDCKIGKFCEIAPGAILLGKSEIGDCCSIGSNAVILPKVKLGNCVVVGAGSVVTKNVNDHQSVAGVPAKRITK